MQGDSDKVAAVMRVAEKEQATKLTTAKEQMIATTKEREARKDRIKHVEQLIDGMLVVDHRHLPIKERTLHAEAVSEYCHALRALYEAETLRRELDL